MDRSALRTTSAHVVVAGDEIDRRGAVVVDDETEHHLRRVLRLRDGERVSVTDGRGRWRLAVVRIGDGAFGLEPASEVHTAPRREHPIHIAAAMPKGDRLEWMVQKVTELGVDRLTLLHAERSVVRWRPERIEAQRARLQRVALEAARQSRRVFVLDLDGPVDAVSVLGGFAAAEPGGAPLGPGDRAVAVGPEGGWSDAELDAAATRVGLTDTILRTETAAVTAAALCVTFDR